MTSVAKEVRSTETRVPHRIRSVNYRGRMWLLMLFADACAFSMGFGLVLLANNWLKFMTFDLRDFEYLIVPMLCLMLYINSRLYPGVGINPADEIKLVTQYTLMAFGVGLIVFTFLRRPWQPNPAAFAASSLLCILAVLLTRWGVRIVAARMGLWGEPVVVLASGDGLGSVACYFCKRGRLGFRPAIVTPATAGDSCPVCRLPLMDAESVLTSGDDYFSQQGIETVMVDLSSTMGALDAGSMKDPLRLFRRVIFISTADWLEGASMRVKDFEGLIGISAQKNALSPLQALLKRTLDIVVSVIGVVCLVPVWVVVAALIALDSRGAVFYSQERAGRDGRKLKVYKFRTMMAGAEAALQSHLAANPEARNEWDKTQKLQNDPRITRIGRILRKFSIDEFPQLFNVLLGQMSLVGPRPLPEYHFSLLSDNLRALRKALRPGMTGMWQVSGRTDSGTAGMERWDTYYVHNWSLWLDIYVLLRTVWVVLRRDGAY